MMLAVVQQTHDPGEALGRNGFATDNASLWDGWFAVDLIVGSPICWRDVRNKCNVRLIDLPDVLAGNLPKAQAITVTKIKTLFMVQLIVML